MSLIPSTLNADVRTLADLLAACPIGEVVSYEDMTRALGAPILARRYILLAALKVANRECGAIFGTVRSVGCKRLPAEDAHLLGHAVRRHIRRSTRKATNFITEAIRVANYLEPEAQRKAYAEINTLGLLAHIAKDSVAEKVSEPSGEAKPEPVAKVMAKALAAIGART